MKCAILFGWRIFILGLLVSGVLSAEEALDGHFSSWEKVPSVIDSLSADSGSERFDELFELTRITLGAPQVSVCLNKEDHRLYLLQTKAAWEKWWKETGKSVSDQKRRDAKVDEEAFEMAMKFLSVGGEEKPKKVLPVWIPKRWRLCVSFTNGDYMGREKEIWMIDRQEDIVNFTKLRGDYSGGEWGVSLEKRDSFTCEKADEMLKALCYVHQYASSLAKPDSLGGLYYPCARMSLRGEKNGLIWNAEGYNFHKEKAEFGKGEAGRSYYFLRSMYGDIRTWTKQEDPSSELMAPYRDLLSNSKPYFYSNASDIVGLFGQSGKELELKVLVGWAKKQQLAIDPNMDWTVCCDHFGTGSKVNVLNFTRVEFEGTVKQINKMEKRLGLKVDGELNKKEEEMLALKKEEEEADIMRHPQPLRTLIRAARHPEDPDLRRLKAVITAIRKNPDPRLFPQLIAELDDGTCIMSGLLGHVLLDEGGFLGVPRWGAKQEAIAVNACIDALSIAKENGELSDLVEVLLKVFGGGEIGIDDGGGGLKIELRFTEAGYSCSHGGSANPLSIKDAQEELRRLYIESKKK